MSGHRGGTGTAAPAPRTPGPPQRRGLASFLLVWLPSVVVIIASGACLFTLSWWLSQSPGGGGSLGVVIGVSSVVSLLTVFVFSGPLDRTDRGVSITRLLSTLLLPLGALAVILGLSYDGWAVAGAALCYIAVSTLESLYLATNETLCADLAPDGWPSARTALLTQIHSQVERVVAPTFAGLALTAGHVSAVPVAAALVVAAMLAVIHTGRRRSAVAAAAAPAAPDETSSTTTQGPLRSLWDNARAALRLMRGHRDLVFLVQLGILGNLVVFPFYAVLPAFLSDYTTGPHDVAVWYSRAATAYGVGMLSGSVLLMQRKRATGVGGRALTAAGCCLALICTVLIALTLTARPAAVVAAMAVNGALFTVLVAIGGAVWLDRTPPGIRVRVFSLRRLTVFSSIPLGTALMGVGGAALGYRPFVRLLAVVVIALLGASWLAFRRRAEDRTEEPSTATTAKEA